MDLHLRAARSAYELIYQSDHAASFAFAIMNV